MAADERSMALKKAYAEIILNSAKEAAARILVSERKALRFECELKNVKEDAIQMLSRLKQMMDSKISEAKAASCTRQKKIEELEAQLQEAKDIVKDLREELKSVQAELKRFSSPSKEVKVNKRSEENRLETTESVACPHLTDTKNSNVDQRNKNRSFYDSLFPLKKRRNGSPDLPSIILRSKKTELYRNGCTQRIRACERPPPNKKIPFSDVPIAREKLRKAPSLDQPLDQVKEMDPTADNSCVTSPSSGKNATNTSIEENCHEKNSEGSMSKAHRVPSQPTNSRVIKYTFQRKRKRGTLTDGNGYNEKSEEKARLEGEKVSSIEESTPEKIQLEQVARQLVSLSRQKTMAMSL